MNNRTATRAGFTVIELLVSAGICGTLLAVLMPAVQHSRARMHDTECRNHLRQIGLALHNHEQTHGFFPTMGGYQIRLRSFLENRNDVWRCPGDSRFHQGSGDDFSYLANDGTRFRYEQRDGFLVQPMKDNFTRSRDTRASDISDGLSQTAAMSERLLVSGFNVASTEAELLSEPRRFLWYVSRRQPDEAGLARECAQSRITPFPLHYRTSGTVAGAGYDHIMPPNRIGCQNFTPSTAYLCAPVGDMRTSAVTATSEHGGYVNLLLCDGSVRAIQDGIDFAAWQALGTRAGGEPLTLD